MGHDNDLGTPLKKDEFELLIKDINPVSMAADWYDGSMRIYYAAGAATKLLTLVKQTLPGPLFSHIFGDTGNLVGTIGGLAFAEEEQRKVNDAKRNLADKKASLEIKRIIATQSIVAYTATTLAHYGVIKGVAAIACVKFGAFAFAAGAWAAFGFAVKNLDTALDKINMAYLANDRLVKYENVEKKRKILEKIVNFKSSEVSEKVYIDYYNELDKEAKSIYEQYLNAEMSALSSKIAELERIQSRLKNQALALYRVNKDKDTFKYKNEPLIGEAVSYTADTIKSKLSEIGVEEAEIQKRPSDDDKNLADYLQLKQDEKVSQCKDAVAEWGLTAVAMTLFALAPFFPHLLIPATCLFILVGVIKLCHVILDISDRLSNRDKVGVAAKLLMVKDENHIMTNINKMKNFPIFKDQNYSDDQLFSYRAAFELSMKDPINKSNIRYEEAFYNKINEMSDREPFLNDARRTYIVNQKMGESFLKSTTKKDQSLIFNDNRFFQHPDDRTTENKKPGTDEVRSITRQ